MDFGLKEVNVLTHNIQEDIVTFTRDELALALQGGDLELTRVKESLIEKLAAEKATENACLTQIAQSPLPAQAKLEAKIDELTQDVQGISQCLHPG